MMEPWTEGTKPWYEKGYSDPLWVTAAQVVSRVPCEIAALLLVGDVASTIATLYDGTNAASPVLLVMNAIANDQAPFTPVEPILCKRGLYVVVDASVKGLLVMWRPLPAGWRP